MAEEKTIDLFQTESNPDPYAGRDPSLYGTVDFPTANFITMVKTGEITYDPEDTMHRQALADYEEVYDAASTADKQSMISPEEIAGLSGAFGGAAVGALADNFLLPKTTTKNPTANAILVRDNRKKAVLANTNLSAAEQTAQLNAIDANFAAQNPTPSFKDSILFLEDVGEDIYRIDRMLTQLKLSGILNEISGFIFGKCTNCDVGSNSLSLHQVFEDHIKPLNIPAFYGAMISHEDKNVTIPVGLRAKMDAKKMDFMMMSKAVN